MDKHILNSQSGNVIPIKEYKKSRAKGQAASTDKRQIQYIPFKPRPARVLDVLTGK